jgi:DNA-binding NtrC family response regulator
VDVVVGTNANAKKQPRDVAALNVLVVDDDQDVCEYLFDFLSSEGFTVKLQQDSTQALETLRESEFHVVVLDLMMPKLSGTDLLGQIRAVDDDIAIIILTGYPSLETATSIEHDVSAYIRKPFSVDEFREAIGRIAKKKGLILRREDELHATIGRSIRELRKARGLTLKQMSRRTNLSVSLLSQIERAESSASVSSLVKVSAALDVRIAELFENDEPEMSRSRRPATEDAPLNAPRSS